jgi:hypothetical protein
MSSTKVFLYNGPPRSGKDSAAVTLTQMGLGHFEKFAWPLKAAFASITGAQIDPWGNVEPFESTKSDLIPWLGTSYRQWQIDFSESFMKPNYGSDIFGRLLVQRVTFAGAGNRFNHQAIFISDSGFAEEAKYVAQEFGEENVLLVRIHRPGYDFAGDSRSYLYDILPNEIDVVNDASVEDYLGKIKGIFTEFMNKGN